MARKVLKLTHVIDHLRMSKALYESVQYVAARERQAGRKAQTRFVIRQLMWLGIQRWKQNGELPQYDL